MNKYEERFTRIARELNDPSFLGCVPGAAVEPFQILAEEERKAAKERKKRLRKERRQNK